MPKKKKDPNEKKDPVTLDQVEVGQTVWVTRIELDDDQNMRRRLQDLGIIEGTRIVCRQVAPSGNPKSFLVRGAVIAIRTQDSSRIYVSTEHPEENYDY